MNYLVAFGDTEGLHGKNGLWSLTLVLTAIVNGPRTLSATGRNLPKLRYVKDCYHVLNYNGQEGSDKATGRALSSHFHTIHELQQEYDAEGVLLCFWNAKHDRAQIEPYRQITTSIPNLYIVYVDMLKLVKELVRLPKYKLGYVRYEVYGSDYERRLGAKQDHTSLQDTLDMIYVVYAAILDSAVEQTDYASSEERRTRPGLIASRVASTPKKMQIKKILNHDFFLIGLLNKTEREQTSRTSPPRERNVSVDLVELKRSLVEKQTQEKYVYFHIDGQDYKVRKGFESSTSIWYKNYGLYVARGAQYKRILAKERKRAILDLFLATEAEAKEVEQKEGNGIQVVSTGSLPYL